MWFRTHKPDMLGEALSPEVAEPNSCLGRWDSVCIEVMGHRAARSFCCGEGSCPGDRTYLSQEAKETHQPDGHGW